MYFTCTIFFLLSLIYLSHIGCYFFAVPCFNLRFFHVTKNKPNNNNSTCSHWTRLPHMVEYSIQIHFTLHKLFIVKIGKYYFYFLQHNFMISRILKHLFIYFYRYYKLMLTIFSKQINHVHVSQIFVIMFSRKG